MPALVGCLEYFGDDVHRDDILATNDPYEGAQHLPDIYLFKPVFAGETLLAYACAMSHHTDVGGRVAGGNSSDCTEIYQEGLRIPPLKLYRRGKPDRTLFRIIEKAVRVPDKVLGDLRGQVSALRLAEQELLRLADRHGAERFLELQDEVLDHTENLTRMRIRELPDGAWSFTDHVDDDGFGCGPIAIVANLTKEGDEIRIEEYSLATDSEGAGAFRGGIGLTRQYRFLADETLVQLRSDRMDHPPYGLCGGQAARPSKVAFARRGAADEPMPSKFIVMADDGDTLRIEMPGGGGWGNPLSRDPAAVLADVIAEKISPGRAEAVYGVVLLEGGHDIDDAATGKLRAERLGASEGSIARPFA